MGYRHLLIIVTAMYAGGAFAASVPSDSAACASCHGARGEGNRASGSPRIAGQSATYLRKQLDAYADGRRSSSVMAPIAQRLSPDQRATLSAYYAAIDSAPLKQTATPKANARAQTLATVGDERLRVQACQNCHGPGAAGEPPTFPYLAGQMQGYLKTTLGDWKSGTRNTDASGQMSAITKQLSAADINALALYYAQQPLAARIPTQAPAHAASDTATDTPTTMQPPTTQPTTGTGSEGGEPTTGGSQGPGGGGAGREDK